MSDDVPRPPEGSGEHPIALVVLSANNLAASSAFYSKVFGWQLHSLSGELISIVAPAGPPAALRSNVAADFPGMVPYIWVSDVDVMLGRVVKAGAAIERTTWSPRKVGKLARFKAVHETIYGLTDTFAAGGSPHLPVPLGSSPKPPAGAICGIEMYAADGAEAARLFSDLFGWGTLETMPQYVAFDPGAGVGGVFQSHTPELPALAYIYATDVEAKLAEIQSAGGELLGEAMRMPDFGCFAYFKDPSGTNMGLIGP